MYLHHFFPNQVKVPDTAIFPYLEKTLPPERAREWYSALMDYGSYLKKVVGNPNQRSTHYTKQSAYKGSDREIRGTILRILVDSRQTLTGIKKQIPKLDGERIETQL